MKAARSSGDMQFLLVADACRLGVEATESTSILTSTELDIIFFAENSASCALERHNTYQYINPKRKTSARRAELPFAIAERLEHVDEVVLLLDTQLPAWEIACEFFRLCKCVFEIVCLRMRRNMSMRRSTVTCVYVHSTYCLEESLLRFGGGSSCWLLRQL